MFLGIIRVTRSIAGPKNFSCCILQHNFKCSNRLKFVTWELKDVMSPFRGIKRGKIMLMHTAAYLLHTNLCYSVSWLLFFFEDAQFWPIFNQVLLEITSLTSRLPDPINFSCCILKHVVPTVIQVIVVAYWISWLIMLYKT